MWPHAEFNSWNIDTKTFSESHLNITPPYACRKLPPSRSTGPFATFQLSELWRRKMSMKILIIVSLLSTAWQISHFYFHLPHLHFYWHLLEVNGQPWVRPESETTNNSIFFKNKFRLCSNLITGTQDILGRQQNCGTWWIYSQQSLGCGHF